jgi:hypothetical protein
MNKTDLIYLAGFIDADGCITVNRSKRGEKWYFGAVVNISGTRREPHDLASSIWGGKVWCWMPKNSSHRPNFQWNRQGMSAVNAITDLLPFLRVKREHAELALRLHKGQLDFDAKNAIALAVFALNQDRRPKENGCLVDGVEHKHFPAALAA